jgi:hypothetical protein
MKKQSKLATVSILMKEGKTAQEISKETGIKLGYTYSLMSKVRAQSGKKLTGVNKPKIEAHAQPRIPTEVQALYDELGRLRNLVLNRDAVIRYLEDKVIQALAR